MKVHERTAPITDSLLLKLTHAVLQGAALASLAVAAGCAHDSDGDEPVRAAPDSGRRMDASTPMRDSGLSGNDSGLMDASTPMRDSGPSRNDSGLSLVDSGMKPPMMVERPTETYSLADLGCSGPDFDGGYYGQCCVRAGCYTPPAGEPCAPAKTAAGLRSEIAGLPQGSGTCGCSPSIDGPFAPNPEDAVAEPGACCYTFGVITCTGRPLTVLGAFVIAPLAHRSDWAPFA